MAKELITLKDYEKEGKEALNRIVAWHDVMEHQTTMDVEPIVRQRRQDGHNDTYLIKAIEKTLQEAAGINLKEFLPYRESQGVYNEDEE